MKIFCCMCYYLLEVYLAVRFHVIGSINRKLKVSFNII
jgi:hypothetical protein